LHSLHTARKEKRRNTAKGKARSMKKSVSIGTLLLTRYRRKRTERAQKSFQAEDPTSTILADSGNCAGENCFYR